MKCCLFCAYLVLSSVPQLESEPEVKQIGEAPEDVPFAIPEKWKWIPLNKFSEERRTVSPNTITGEVELWSIPAYDVGSPEKVNSEQIGSSKKEVVNGDVLLSKIVPNIKRAWIVKSDHPHKLASTEWLTFSGKNILDPEFMRQVFLSPYFRGKMMDTISGMGSLKRANPRILQQTLIPVPHLQEQRRIVTKINQLFEQIDCAEKAYKELSGPLSERFRQLCLEKAIQGKLVPQLESEPEVEQIGDAPEDVPFEIPEKWKWVNLHSTLKAISDGSHNPPPNVGHGVPVLSAKNVVNGIIDTNSVTRWTTEEQWSIEDKKIHIQSGDVLLTIVGTIGRTAVVPNDCEKFMLQRSVCVMKPKECVNPKFLALILNSPSLFEWIMDHASGTAQKGIYLKTVKQIPIPLPSIEEQRRIVAKLNELLGSISQLEQTISTP